MSLTGIVCVTDFIAASWKNMWDEALDSGVCGTKLIQVLFGSLSRPVFGDKLTTETTNVYFILQRTFLCDISR